MAKFKGVVLNCKVCGEAFKVSQGRASTAEYCSTPCSAKGRAEKRKKRVVLQCEACGKHYESVACHAGRRKYCSYECKHSSADYRNAIAEKVSGEKNGAWAGGLVPHPDGYVYARCTHHPFASNGYVLEHRLVMEEWLRETDPKSKFLMRLGGQLYLIPTCHVHHRDENKSNNDIANLECLTPSQHQRVHAAMRRQRRAKQSG